MNPEPIFRALLGYRQAAVVRAAIELDCFSAIAEGRSTAAAVAKSRGGTGRSVRILLDAVAASTPAVLRKKGNSYALTPVSRRFLVRSGPAYIGRLMPLYGHRRMWDGFFDLPAAVRAGRSVMEKDAHSARQDFWEDFARATAQEAAIKAARMVRLLGKTPRPCEILDIACGSGMYGATFARRLPGAALTLFDQPNVLVQTRKIVDVPATYAEGDLFRTPFGGPYDLIISSHVLHHFNPADCLKLLRKVAAALKPGGRLVIQEFISDERRSQNVQALMFAVTMLVWTREGDAYCLSDYRKWLKQAGFRKVAFHPQEEPGDFLVATR
jgi:2-polyprenyl-3-methyl-5-hydroxy-6-metoxy-1,4-benzoquinol methylase